MEWNLNWTKFRYNVKSYEVWKTHKDHTHHRFRFHNRGRGENQASSSSKISQKFCQKWLKSIRVEYNIIWPTLYTREIKVWASAIQHTHSHTLTTTRSYYVHTYEVSPWPQLISKILNFLKENRIHVVRMNNFQTSQ